MPAEKKAYERPNPGIFYMIPNPKKPGSYTIFSEIEETNKSTAHLFLWDKVSKIVENRFKKEVSPDAYTGMPRGRVIEPPDLQGVWLVAHGGDFPIEKYKSDIFSDFSLQDAHGIGKVKFVIDGHEKMGASDKKEVEEDLGIIYNPTGWTFKKK